MTVSKYLVVANGEPPSLKLLYLLKQKHSFLVAVDGGLITCLNYGLQPDLLIGDFDSVPEPLRQSLSHIEQIHTPDQNQSDLEKALAFLLTQNPSEITVCGALGKRLDHTLTNICILSRYPDKVRFETDTETCFALLKESVVQCQIGQTLSLIPMSSRVEGVTTQGLKWELTEANLDKYFLSVSNVCLKNPITIRFQEGDLVICLERLGAD